MSSLDYFTEAVAEYTLPAGTYIGKLAVQVFWTEFFPPYVHELLVVVEIFTLTEETSGIPAVTDVSDPIVKPDSCSKYVSEVVDSLISKVKLC